MNGVIPSNKVQPVVHTKSSAEDNLEDDATSSLLRRIVWTTAQIMILPILCLPLVAFCGTLTVLDRIENLRTWRSFPYFFCFSLFPVIMTFSLVKRFDPKQWSRRSTFFLFAFVVAVIVSGAEGVFIMNNKWGIDMRAWSYILWPIPIVVHFVMTHCQTTMEGEEAEERSKVDETIDVESTTTRSVSPTDNLVRAWSYDEAKHDENIDIGEEIAILKRSASPATLKTLPKVGLIRTASINSVKSAESEGRKRSVHRWNQQWEGVGPRRGSTQTPFLVVDEDTLRAQLSPDEVDSQSSWMGPCSVVQYFLLIMITFRMLTALGFGVVVIIFTATLCVTPVLSIKEATRDVRHNFGYTCGAFLFIIMCVGALPHGITNEVFVPGHSVTTIAIVSITYQIIMSVFVLPIAYRIFRCASWTRPQAVECLFVMQMCDALIVDIIFLWSGDQSKIDEEFVVLLILSSVRAVLRNSGILSEIGIASSKTILHTCCSCFNITLETFEFTQTEWLQMHLQHGAQDAISEIIGVSVLMITLATDFATTTPENRTITYGLDANSLSVVELKYTIVLFVALLEAFVVWMIWKKKLKKAQEEHPDITDTEMLSFIATRLEKGRNYFLTCIPFVILYAINITFTFYKSTLATTSNDELD
eukprot:TRINITY_DN3451_c0_g2_i3.p1 TRINITY_DN3451_c0_g2~~TRINITY_DN3451_c0_g2_i3.p1  ORF type:complete len:645 (-),score=160.30 TRINITY_DN3451_c0_g2_i3:75-2009(-)